MPDRDDQMTGHDDDILDQPVRVDAAGIDILGTQTAQVAVTLPVADDDDGLDDDVVADETVPVAEPVVIATLEDTGEFAPVRTSDLDVHDAEIEPPATEEAPAAVVRAPEPVTSTPTTRVRVPVATNEPVAPSTPSTPAVPTRSEPTPVAPVDATPAPVTLAARRVDQEESKRESADLLTADRLLETDRLPRREPEGAWPNLVYTLSGGRVRLGDSRRSRERRALDERIAAPLDGGARFVAVLSRKGGVGKTTVTALLGMALADARDDRVIALDANPDRGTLAERVGRPSGKTVRDLASQAAPIHGFNEISAIVARDDTRLDVLASDTDPHVSEAFDDADYREVAALAAHYYSIVLTDTGTGIVHSVMDATLEAADALVIVSGLSVDEARLASETLTWLETNGYTALARSAVVVLNASRPGAPLVRLDELEEHFRSRVRQVVRVPYDARIATGSAISFRDLQPATRAAARQLAAVAVEGLRVAAAS
ncbi:MinD-like ATPase involved in chromosome partitioning or flagellar assembly [Microbacterium sp. SORGH_AS428]|uniref:nucleotide-binding protein n=1 Tax=Microbacterium sp. SORGH_AS_0428 TaxID=3041788 RepID=UPI00285FB0DB|nr:AAA family ATPase [Microbacterium sp. SORGH_AS_0428]MDR6198702.1 MinD-like ATPase involved in chromosome partitioning or flagellar assembly [Microbacterium sp. SORGH_AS_0428]